MTKTHEELLREIGAAAEYLYKQLLPHTEGKRGEVNEAYFAILQAKAALQTANAVPDEEVVEVMLVGALNFHRPDPDTKIKQSTELSYWKVEPTEHEVRAALGSLKSAGYRIVRG